MALADFLANLETLATEAQAEFASALDTAALKKAGFVPWCQGGKAPRGAEGLG